MDIASQIKAMHEEIGKAFEQFKATNDDRIKALREGNEVKAHELDMKLSKIDTDIAKFTEMRRQAEQQVKNLQERIEELEAKNDRPGKTVTEKLHDEYAETFNAWVRSGGQSTEQQIQLKNLEKQLNEKMDITIGTPAAGGYAVPKGIGAEIERLEKLFSPVRGLIKVVKVGTSDYRELVNIRGTTAGWVGETGTRSATNTAQFREATPTHGELYAYPQVSEWSLDDMFFDVESWLAEEIAEEFAIAEGIAVLTGNGTTKPTGMLNSAPTATDDFGSPLRAAAVYQFVPSAASPDAILPDTLFDLLYKVNARYRVRSTWTFNSATAASIRKLKDTTNQYLWQPGLQAGEPDRLLGFPTAIWENMDSVGANKYPVGFGDWRRGYLLVDRVGLRITRDEVTNPGYIRFYVRRREGGIVLNNNAVKWLKTT